MQPWRNGAFQHTSHSVEVLQGDCRWNEVSCRQRLRPQGPSCQEHTRLRGEDLQGETAKLLVAPNCIVPLALLIGHLENEARYEAMYPIFCRLVILECPEIWRMTATISHMGE